MEPDDKTPSLPIRTLAIVAYVLADFGTFIFLTFFDGYEYNGFNWIIAIPVNVFLSQIWPIYWLILRWLPTLG
jgi:hypothetical protein